MTVIVICCISLSWRGWFQVIHHTLSGIAVAYSMYTGEGQLYTYMVLISEVTTPEINMRWLVFETSSGIFYKFSFSFNLVLALLKVPWHFWYEAIKCISFEWHRHIFCVAGESMILLLQLFIPWGLNCVFFMTGCKNLAVCLYVLSRLPTHRTGRLNLFQIFGSSVIKATC